ncbi:MAG: helix-turn-helix domain-containing protein [Flavobacteriales bacterium]|nr:helix-turn-helix domain-containing protein [Flavobacteriales bacterium]
MKTSLEIVIYNLKRLRAEKGWSQTKLGELSGIDPSYISRIEKGKYNVSLEALDKLARAFEVDAYELLQYKKVDELSMREKLEQVESLDPLKKMMVEEMINAFLREKEFSNK